MVGGTLTAGDKDHLARLFLEAMYLYDEEGQSKSNSTMLCVLTDGNTWHLIKTDMRRKPHTHTHFYNESNQLLGQCSAIGMFLGGLLYQN